MRLRRSDTAYIISFKSDDAVSRQLFFRQRNLLIERGFCIVISNECKIYSVEISFKEIKSKNDPIEGVVNTCECVGCNVSEKLTDMDKDYINGRRVFSLEKTWQILRHNRKKRWLKSSL